MNRLRWWLVSGAGIPWALRIGARVSSTHPTGQRACRRPANFIVAGQGIKTAMSALDRERLRELGVAFEHLLEPFGLSRADWDRNADSALAVGTGSGGRTAEADPFIASQSLHDALLSWRSLLPRSAHDRFTAEFLRAGLPVLALRTNQIPGADPRLEPVAPTALFGTLPGATLILGRLGDGLFPLWNPTGQLAGLGIALAYSGVAVVLALRSGLWRRQTRWPSPRHLLSRAGRWLLPAFIEELVFRGVLLPSALDGVQPLALLPWMALSVGLFVAWHRLAGWSVLNCRVRPGFQDPRVLVQTALLGVACSLAYGVSGSLWWAVLLHWLAVVAWREWLGAGSQDWRVVELLDLRRAQFQQDRSTAGDGGAA